jgi:hypothetical protein
MFTILLSSYQVIGDLSLMVLVFATLGVRVGMRTWWTGALGLPLPTDQNWLDTRFPPSNDSPASSLARLGTERYILFSGTSPSGQQPVTAINQQAIRSPSSHSSGHLADPSVDTQDTMGLHQPTKVPSSLPSTITDLLEMGS